MKNRKGKKFGVWTIGEVREIGPKLLAAAEQAEKDGRDEIDLEEVLEPKLPHRVKREAQFRWPVIALSQQARALAELTRKRLIDPDTAQSLLDIIKQLSEVAKKNLANHLGTTRAATEKTVKRGAATREHVIKVAAEMKRKTPTLSKQKAARVIAGTPPSPCKFDQAKKYIDAEWNKSAWDELGLGSNAR